MWSWFGLAETIMIWSSATLYCASTGVYASGLVCAFRLADITAAAIRASLMMNLGMGASVPTVIVRSGIPEIKRAPG
jgi:hypothetical protein